MTESDPIRTSDSAPIRTEIGRTTFGVESDPIRTTESDPIRDKFGRPNWRRVGQPNRGRFGQTSGVRPSE